MQNEIPVYDFLFSSPYPTFPVPLSTHSQQNKALRVSSTNKPWCHWSSSQGKICSDLAYFDNISSILSLIMLIVCHYKYFYMVIGNNLPVPEYPSVSTLG